MVYFQTHVISQSWFREWSKFPMAGQPKKESVMIKRNIKPKTQGRRSDNGFISKIKQGLAALLFATLICGTMMGCGADEGNTEDDRDITGRVVAYVDANGELATGKVLADHGDTLDMGGFELSQSEILGIRTTARSLDPITLAKGRHLDAYGDQFADIEYLHGMAEKEFVWRNANWRERNQSGIYHSGGWHYGFRQGSNFRK